MVCIFPVVTIDTLKCTIFIMAFVRLLFPMRSNILCKCHIKTELEPIKNAFVYRVWGLVVSVKCLEVLLNRFYCTKCKYCG